VSHVSSDQLRKKNVIKKLLIAAAFVFAGPALVFSQDIFWSFDSGSNVTTTAGDVGTSGTAYIFSDQPVDFDAIDLNFTNSNSSVLLLTGGTAFNEGFNSPFLTGVSFDSSVLTVDPAGADGNLFSVNVLENGVRPVTTPFNNAFEAGAGSGSGALKLAEVTYDIVGAGTSTLELSLGPQGVVVLPGLFIPTFGSASLEAVEVDAVPEPSSAALLVFGSIGLVARRKRRKA